MIELYMSTTPNGMKIALMLAEADIPHRVTRLSLSKGEQHAPWFVKLSPNAKIPVIVDHAPADGGVPITVFESGAILLYLAEKHGVLLPIEPRAKLEAQQWLFWQTSNLGPMGGQAGHFTAHAPERVPYAIHRYTREMTRLYRALETRLEGRDFILGDYSVVDIATYPWIVPYRAHGQDLTAYPNVKRWFDAIATRPATRAVYAGVEDAYAMPLSVEAMTNLFQSGSPS